ncbi:hypothetical protein BH24ACT22_BH24ACT22_19850 [soil metagenome]
MSGVFSGNGFRPEPEGDKLLKDDGPVSVYQNAVLKMPADGAGEDAALYLASLSHQVFHCIPVRNVRDVLLDYGASVQVLRNVVGGGADDLDPPLVRPQVRVRPDESR